MEPIERNDHRSVEEQFCAIRVDLSVGEELARTTFVGHEHDNGDHQADDDSHQGQPEFGRNPSLPVGRSAKQIAAQAFAVGVDELTMSRVKIVQIELVDPLLLCEHPRQRSDAPGDEPCYSAAVFTEVQLVQVDREIVAIVAVLVELEVLKVAIRLQVRKRRVHCKPIGHRAQEYQFLSGQLWI